MAHEHILDLVRRWANAERDADADRLDQLLAPDFAGIGPRGFVLTREQWLGRYRGGELKNESFTLDDPTVRVYGDAAMVIGIQNQRTSFQGHDASGRFRVTLVLVRTAGRWLIAGWQASGPVADAPLAGG